MKRYLFLTACLLACSAMPAAAQEAAKLYVHMANGRVLIAENTFQEGDWTVVVLNIQNQIYVPRNAVEKIERVPKMERSVMNMDAPSFNVRPSGPAGDSAPSGSSATGRGLAAGGNRPLPASRDPRVAPPPASVTQQTDPLVVEGKNAKEKRNRLNPEVRIGGPKMPRH